MTHKKFKKKEKINITISEQRTLKYLKMVLKDRVSGQLLYQSSPDNSVLSTTRKYNHYQLMRQDNVLSKKKKRRKRLNL